MVLFFFLYSVVSRPGLRTNQSFGGRCILRPLQLEIASQSTACWLLIKNRSWWSFEANCGCDNNVEIFVQTIARSYLLHQEKNASVMLDEPLNASVSSAMNCL
jgi:hypothetical protein